jgi:hypothetical protein
MSFSPCLRRVQVWPKLIRSFVSIAGCPFRPDEHEGAVVGSFCYRSSLAFVAFSGPEDPWLAGEASAFHA